MPGGVREIGASMLRHDGHRFGYRAGQVRLPPGIFLFSAAWECLRRDDLADDQ